MQKDMRNKVITLFAFASLLFSNGCEKLPVGDDFLEKPPSVDVTVDTIFSNLEYAKRYLFAGYNTLYYGLNIDFGMNNFLNTNMLESITDINHSNLAWTGAPGQYYSGLYNAAQENRQAIISKYPWYKTRHWDGIRIGYNFLKFSDRIPDVSETELKQLKAEARMFIAMHYTDIYRHFGGVPWMSKAVDVDDDMRFPRLTSKATMDSIVSMIDRAIPDLPWVISDLSNDDGRFTQAAAMGLKARVLLFGASPIFNSPTPYLDGEASQMNIMWHGGYDQNLWKRAADAAKELIDKIEAQGGYALVNTGDPRADFTNAYATRGNGEVLISVRKQFRSPMGRDYGVLPQISNHTSNPTFNFVQMFQMTNGLHVDEPGSGYDPNNPYVNRDPRLYESVVTNGDRYQGRTAALWVGGRERQNPNANLGFSGHYQRKFLMDRNPATSRGAITHWPYLRLPEIYMSYAEALNEFHNGPTAEAYTYANKARERVGMPGLRPGLSKEQFRAAILNERAVEFGYEEVRWFDLVRWKMEEDFKKPLYRMHITRNTDGTFNYQQIQLPDRHWATNWDPKWYFSALPYDQINMGYGLVQNPGW
jgi:starch-binding outer membrane protein, SusD/RagB family